ncbi:hypothetical protein ACFFQF_09290 [Haladaptatus pallidirubidus]|uniref:hypothetical protein n=1 Tax=Haladaptatus pallidirubidus TaxID=1008152 RepID=UPI0035E54161
MNWPNPRRSASIARVEYRRSIRAMLKNPVQLLGFAFFLLLFVGVPTLGVPTSRTNSAAKSTNFRLRFHSSILHAAASPPHGSWSERW